MRPVDRLFQKLPQLPTIPAIVQELISSLGRDDVDLADLIAKVRQDQSLSARVLRLANSPYYGGRKTVGGIDDAVAMIGLNSLRSIVIASGVTGAIARVEGIDLARFWKHSQLTAQTAKALARLASINPEYAYAAGLMHRIGQLLINLSFPEIGQQVAKNCRNLSVGELAALERLNLSFNHAEVSAELARQWHFPLEIQDALLHYIKPDAEGATPYAGVVHLAASLAFGIEQDLPDEVILSRVNHAIVRTLGLEEVDWLVELVKMREAAGAGSEQYS
ncbi:MULTISPECIES: HDOD domain-containing protein [unclassified Uliginosibacterium]|uniref:HDOD domain-containing protein n=1 Tax=unclassified Uliginosibacterium TaxID=2621521 RepID=UPI000C7CD12B|nr:MULTISPECIES: HDOD domain-containing protein [unclassified Uliginosibacterium]MDO6387676.1 HDOD domain-containing protein [Uliginosibacterium sp. 31-12]PLK47983.1 signal transduction protein [Uliginosibacterium sp. TH139]